MSSVVVANIHPMCRLNASALLAEGRLLCCVSRQRSQMFMATMLIDNTHPGPDFTMQVRGVPVSALTRSSYRGRRQVPSSKDCVLLALLVGWQGN